MTPTLSAEEMDREVARTAPERIYLVIGGECPSDASFAELSEVTWCEDDVDGNGIEYVRARHPKPECGEVATGLNFAAWLITQSDFKLTADRVDAAKSAWDYLLPAIAQMDANHSALQHEADEDKRLLAERDAKVEALTEYAAAVEKSAEAAEHDRDQLRARVAELEQAMHDIERRNDSPARFDAEIQQIIDDALAANAEGKA